MANSDAVGPKVRASHHCLSGCRHGELPQHSLVDRARAAARAGIAEIGACVDDMTGWDPRRLHRLVREQNVRVAELEWVDLSEPRRVAEDDLLRMADVFGSRQLNVGVCNPETLSNHWLGKRLKFLAQRAADHNLTVAFEPVVFGSVPDVGQVQHIIELAAEPNIGVLLDVYHMARTCWDKLDHVWAELVTGIQINGIDRVRPLPAWPNGLLHEAQCDRLLPDQGEFPVHDWLTELGSMGVDARLSVEVLSDAQRALPLDEAADRIAGAGHKFAVLWEGVS